MNPKEINKLVARLGALPFFPADDDARIAIAEIFASMAHNTEEVRWTVSRCLQIWDKWEGPHELRSVLCGKFIPADGVNAYSRLPQFADGIPSESEDRNAGLLGPAPAKQLSGDVDDPEFPRDATDLLHEAIERDKAAKKAPLPDEAEIERIKAEQAENVKRREAQEAWKRTA